MWHERFSQRVSRYRMLRHRVQRRFRRWSERPSD
jgi:hypothetical protein